MENGRDWAFAAARNGNLFDPSTLTPGTAASACDMADVHEMMLRKLSEHSFLSQEDITGLHSLTGHTRALGPDEDVVRQGDFPQLSVVVLSGMLARYHTLSSGTRQYLSFHIAGDMPDAQALFLDVMDHSVCAIDKARVGLIPHKEILAMFVLRPAIGFAVWRETLIDAAIFREAVTNNSSRTARTRMAHFFCEQYYRAQAARLAKPGACRLPLNQSQIGQALGMSLVTVNRTIQNLRSTRFMDLRDGMLQVRDWPRLAQLAQFDATYLHLKRPPAL
jgi:CRP-like cAMP-binding protein